MKRLLLLSVLSVVQAEARPVDSVFVSPIIRSLQRTMAQLDSESTDVRDRRRLFASEYDSLTAVIDRIKREPSVDFWDRYRIKSLLTDAEDLAHQMTRADHRLKTLDSLARERALELGSLMDDEIRIALTRLEKFHSTTASDVLINSLYAMLREKARLEAFSLVWDELTVSRVRFFLNEEFESLEQKLVFTEDQRDKLLVYARTIDRGIWRLENDLRVIDRVEEIDRKRRSEVTLGFDRFLNISRTSLRSDDHLSTAVQKLYWEKTVTQNLIQTSEAIVHEIQRLTQLRKPVEQ